MIAGGAKLKTHSFTTLMSSTRPAYQTKFSSKGVYDALVIEDLPSDDEEDAAIIVEPEPPVPAPAPVTEYVALRAMVKRKC
jgi:hypothetical protein